MRGKFIENYTVVTSWLLNSDQNLPNETIHLNYLKKTSWKSRLCKY